MSATIPIDSNALRLLLERFEYTSDRLFQLAAMEEERYHSGMAGELREANAAMCRTLFGYEFATEDGEKTEE
jgi:hypothetical protein